MRILIITMNVGRTAPGIVFERLIYGLSSLHQIDVLTADYDPSIDFSTDPIYNRNDLIVVFRILESHGRILTNKIKIMKIYF
jgi:hypothetical protein